MLNKEVALAVNYALNKGFQIHPEALSLLEGVSTSELGELIKEVVREKMRQNVFFINQDDLKSALRIEDEGELENDLKVIFDPTGKIASAEGVDGYASLFISRYNKLKKIVSKRPEAAKIRSTKLLKGKKPDSGQSEGKKKRESVYVCGLVTNKSLVTDKSHDRRRAAITIEDDTDSLECFAFEDELVKKADGLLIEQFVMAEIEQTQRGTFVIKDIILPEVGEREVGRSKSSVWALFLSDLHAGSKYFLEESFGSLVEWLNSNDPVAQRVGFVVIGGDLIDGVGIYPNQDKELVHLSIEDQLAYIEGYLAKIPKHIQIVIMPGNHDPGRRSLPQPAIPKKYNVGLWDRENFHMVGNPAVVSLNGVRVLMFHGQSIDDVVKITPGLSYAEPVSVMKELLRTRHLCPIYGGNTPIAPELEDMMVIEDVPDIFHVGHVHVLGAGRYRGTLLINSGTWQGQTPFQASVGITPTPGIAVLVNLKTFQVNTKQF